MWGWDSSGSSRSSGCFSGWARPTRMNGRINCCLHISENTRINPGSGHHPGRGFRSAPHPRPVRVKERLCDQPGGAAVAEDFDFGLQPVARALGWYEGEGDGFARMVRIAARGTEAAHLALDPDRLIA